MAGVIHILATCRKPELAPFTELVFKTLRTGFPTAIPVVYINGDAEKNCPNLRKLCKQVGASVQQVSTIHHLWLEKLIKESMAPFWVCDTDIIFYGSIEEFRFDEALAGFRVPEWQDEFSGALTRSRLHPSLMYIDPFKVRVAIEKFQSTLPEGPFTPFCNPIYPVCLPLNGRMYFHDTMSLLYHAIGGHAFCDTGKDRYFHFNFGTIPDLVLPRLKDGGQMAAARKVIMDNPEEGRGAWRLQEQYYRDRVPTFDKTVPIGTISEADSKSAQEWNAKICNGDKDAMQFNDLWYKYVHDIDDLLDTRTDERPIMSTDQILGIFASAAVLYNCPFFVRHRNLLFPIVLSITNTYANSVAWERSPLKRRQQMADVWRTCGNEMYDMVSMITGGWNRARETSPLIRDRDWIGQHDDNGNPT